MANNQDIFTVDVTGTVQPTGVYMAEPRPITEGTPMVATSTGTGGGFWDFVSGIADEAKFGDVLNKYLTGKVTKEDNTTPANQYTTTGNPSDQAGGKLLTDIAEQNTRTQQYVLWAVVGVAALGAVVLLTRK